MRRHDTSAGGERPEISGDLLRALLYMAVCVRTRVVYVEPYEYHGTGSYQGRGMYVCVDGRERKVALRRRA